MSRLFSSSAMLTWQLAAVGALLTTGLVVGSFVHLFKLDVRDQSHIVNASARARVGEGEATLTLGFIVDHPQTVVVRGLGPSLGKYGVARAVTDPSLRVIRDNDGREIAHNDNWRGAGNERLQTDLRDYAPKDEREAACVLHLAPGSYSLIVEGSHGLRGIALAEVYRVND